MNLYQLSDDLRAFVNTQIYTFENDSSKINKAFQGNMENLVNEKECHENI